MTKPRHIDNKDIYDLKTKMYNNCKRWRKTNQISLMYSRAKARAKLKNIEFTISKEHIIIPDKCPLLEVPFSNTYTNPEDPVDYVPSLDRIDNTKGYIPGNVWVISFKANRMKNTATHEEILRFGRNYEDIIKFD